MDERLEISDTGRVKDREDVALVEGGMSERRRMAVTLLLMARIDHPKAAVWLGRRRLVPSAVERAAVQAEIDAILAAERARRE